MPLRQRLRATIWNPVLIGMMDETAPRRGAPEAPPSRLRVYSQARRHSAFVRVLRGVIPLGALVAIGLVVVTFFDPFGQLRGLKLGPFSLSGTKVAMENPRLTGYRKDNRGYEVTADTAYQDIRKPTVLELVSMRARLTMDDNGGSALLVAATGIFDTQSEQLELKRDIHVTMNDGQEAFLASASIDFKGGTVVSTEPVRVKMTNGTIEAAGLRIAENGKSVTFSGRVHALFSEPAAGDAKAPSAPARGALADAMPEGRP